MLIVAASLTAVLGAVSFLLSYNGLTATAPWAGIPAGQSWTIPVVIDGAILVYTLAVLIKRRRGERAVLYWSLLAAFTAASVAGNAFHAWDASAHDATGMAGAAIAGLAPLAVLAATHTLADLIVEPVPPRGVRPQTHSETETIEPDYSSTAVRETESSSRQRAIVAKARAGLSQRQIAAEIGVSKSTVGRILASASE
ncbi:DUF2637 domain-containing protein [Agromyces sp. NPDC058104]|uniref:DUF2637 domain-containing protein n=1 Tax=Agromyces sp. NPDC058104 TaxID=3346342 RepID=UPI0036DE6998